jgi:hypothetical protein
MIISRAATKGAPREKKIKATEKKDTIKYRRAWTALRRVITIKVAKTATAADI